MNLRSQPGNGNPAPGAEKRFLIYHELGSAENPYSYYCGTGQFELHLKLAVELQHAGDSKFLAPGFTFDDGHVSQYTHALPLLDRYGAQGIFFVTAGWINQREHYMDWSHLRELVAQGHSVQSHTWSHPMLTGCSDAQLAEELGRSKKTIEDHVGVPVTAISIPNGRWDSRVLQGCAAAGYGEVFTSDSWRNQEQQNGLQLFGRMNVSQSMTVQRMKRALSRDGGWKRLYDLRAHSKHVLKQLIGDKIYHRLWQTLARAEKDAQ